MKYAVEHGMIDMSYVQEQIEMNKRKELLDKHPYKIWEGKDGKWHTYFPDPIKGRIPKRRGTEKEIEDLIIDYWENESNNTFKSRYKVWVDRQVKLGVSDSQWDCGSPISKFSRQS